MSNVRSSSQISIYDYPEHLNPFYDDDQHKRLRFWKIVGNKSHQPSGRRRSFNLGSLKDLLPLKSFGFKKKSSTLGINKTSESPPPLRRNYGYNSDAESNYSTFDKRIGYSTNNDFIRSSRYRSSLQNMNSVSQLGNRNDVSRATMQYGTSRPIPATRTSYLTTQRGMMTPGSSMNSINTNPFETDDSDADFSSAMTGHQRRLKKKRRAPLPPTLANVHTNASKEEKVELKINENGDENNDGLRELTRLTAEFESFVKSSTDDITQTRGKIQSKEESKAVETSEAVIVDENMNNVRKRSPEKILIESIEVEEIQSPIFEKVSTKFRYQNNAEPEVYEAAKRLEPEIEYLPSSSREETPDYIPVPVREKFHVLRIDENDFNGNVVECQSQKVTEVAPEAAQRTHDNVHVAQVDLDHRKSELAQDSPKPIQRKPEIAPRSPRPPRRPVVQVAPEVVKRAPETINVSPEVEKRSLEISSSYAKVDEIVQDDDQQAIVVNGIHKEEAPSASVIATSQIVTRFREETPIPLATTETITKVETPIQFFEDIETFIRKKEQYHYDDEIYDPDEPPKPPERQRRRSVKDIIESINRSQSLLRTSTPQFEKKYNTFDGQKFSYHEKPVVPPKPNALLKFQRQAESEKKINELLADLQDFNKNTRVSDKAPKFPNESNGDATNNKIVRDRTSGSECNPIPKPKRSLDSS